MLKQMEMPGGFTSTGMQHAVPARQVTKHAIRCCGDWLGQINPAEVSSFGGGGRTRTCEAMRRLIYGQIFHRKRLEVGSTEMRFSA
jgi:hypothetical protein